MKLAPVLFVALSLSACDFTIPDSGCAVVHKDGSKIHVSSCEDDAGVSAGQGGVAGVGGTLAGTGAGGASGGFGHQHDAGSGMGGADAGGAGSAGTGPAHMHGGLPVTLPLPASKPGRTDACFVQARSNPVRDEGGIGAARTRCYVSHFDFNDFIVYGGMPGVAHLHMYWGADETNENGIIPGAGSTCRGGAANLSAYWAPGLLSPEGRALTATYIDVYYKSSNYDLPSNQQVVPPPKGLRMVAGDMRATAAAPQNRNRFYWTCNEDGSVKYSGLPTSNCSTATLNVHFAQCWDGKNLDSPDHKSHVAYPSGGRCPATHPVVIPAISQHILFRNVPSGSKLSCDSATMPGGYCSHADIQVAWLEDVMQSMVTNCINKGLSCGSDLVGDGRSLCIFSGN